jgi:mannonate dehydratase
MINSWRWFGPSDPIPLSDIRQAGATGIVTALHELPNGAVWSREAISERQAMVRDAGLEWPDILRLGLKR